MPRFQLPTAEDELWEQVVIALLRQRDAELQARDHLRLLEELAFHKQFCHKRLTESFVLNTATWLTEQMKLLGPGDKAREWLADLENWQLLVPRQDGSEATYEFPIPGLDEYFAARHLAARWAGGDKRYGAWIPCKRDWWKRRKKLHCLNAYCRTTLPPFRKLLSQAEHEETILIMVGLLKKVEREETFLRGLLFLWVVLPGVSAKLLFFPALSRCRYTHADIVQNVFKMPLFPTDCFILRLEALAGCGKM